MPIPSPYNHLAWSERKPLTVGVPIPIHNYFHRTVFAGSRGCMDATLATFVEKLYAELNKRITQWDPDNERIVAEVLERLNFNPAPPARGAARRRSNPPLAKPAVESGGGHNVNGATP